MGREVRRVPANWQHPTYCDPEVEEVVQQAYIPLYAHFPYNAEEIQEGLACGWLKDAPPHYGCDVMPDWPLKERTHWQMYETTTEGTPISPVCDSPEALAQWLADNKASAFAGMTATYEQWLAMIHEGSALSMILDHGVMRSGVEFEASEAERKKAP